MEYPIHIKKPPRFEKGSQLGWLFDQFCPMKSVKYGSNVLEGDVVMLSTLQENTKNHLPLECLSLAMTLTNVEIGWKKFC